MKIHHLLCVLVTSSIAFSVPVVASTPAKVSVVIPVKFNSRGKHAPVPYRQELMQTGRVRVPTLNLPFTFPGGGQFGPRFNPTTITKNSLAKATAKAAQNASKMHPALKAAVALYGAYEMNCFSQSFPSLCIDNPDPDATNPDGTPLPIDYAEGGAPAKQVQSTVCWGWHATKSQEDPSYPTFSVEGRTDHLGCTKEASKIYRSDWMNWVNQGKRCPSRVVGTLEFGWMIQDQVYIDNPPLTVGCFDRGNPYGASVNSTVKGYSESYVCPPEGPAWERHNVGPIENDAGHPTCYRRKSAPPIPVTPEWVQGKVNENPEPLDDIGLDDFTDWETGSPIPDLFSEPTVDDVSPAFRDAAEGAARGVDQSSDPNAPHYIPPEKQAEFFEELGKWYRGEPFKDVFTGKPVTPAQPSPEPTKMDWSDFPGLTKPQYDSSNNAWGNEAVNAAPNIADEITKAEKSFTDLTEEISKVPTETPFQFDFFDLINFPSGGCRGFSIDVTLRGAPHQILVNQHCPPYDAWGRSLVEWVLGILCMLQIFTIARRTLEVA